MGFRETTWAWGISLNDPIAKLVLIGLADYYNAEKGYAWPSVERLANMADCSVRTVQRKLKDLEDKGYISRTHGHPYFDSRNSNVSSITIYRLNWDGGDTLSGGDKYSEGGDTSCRKGGDTKSHPKDNDKYINKDVLKSDFAEWWSEYPRKVSKQSAMRTYIRTREKDLASKDELLDGVKAYAKKVDGTEAQFISHPDTWLNKGRWADEESNVIPHSNFGAGQKWMPRSKEEFTKRVSPSMRTWYNTHRPEVIRFAQEKGWL